MTIFRVVYFCPITGPGLSRRDRQAVETFKLMTGLACAESVVIATTKWDLVQGKGDQLRSEEYFEQIRDVWEVRPPLGFLHQAAGFTVQFLTIRTLSKEGPVSQGFMARKFQRSKFWKGFSALEQAHIIILNRCSTGRCTCEIHPLRYACMETSSIRSNLLNSSYLLWRRICLSYPYELIRTMPVVKPYAQSLSISGLG